jgi:Cupin-like domain
MLLPDPMDTPGTCLEIDADTFRSQFNRRPFLFSHRLARHPLFELPRLVRLAKTLNGSHVEYNAGRVPVSLPNWQDTPHTGLTAVETIHNAAEICSWMVLKRAEHCPDFKRLLDACLDEIAPLSEPIEPGMSEREAAVFVSSPGSVTPYHMDHEINFLLQLRGTKTVSVFNADDSAVLSEEELEDYFSGPAIHRNMRFAEQYQERATVFELHEGQGLHIPTTAPHWVKNGDTVSISFSACFKTRASLERGNVYRMNAVLRRLGVEPLPWNRSPARDRIKQHAYRALRRAHWLPRPPAAAAAAAGQRALDSA